MILFSSLSFCQHCSRVETHPNHCWHAAIFWLCRRSAAERLDVGPLPRLPFVLSMCRASFCILRLPELHFLSRNWFCPSLLPVSFHSFICCSSVVVPVAEPFSNLFLWAAFYAVPCLLHRCDCFHCSERCYFALHFPTFSELAGHHSLQIILVCPSF